MDSAGFQALLHRLAACWARRDYPAAAAHFTLDVRYADPLRYALQGRAELQAFFTADDGMPQRTAWHATIFDAVRQIGAAEYSYEGTSRYHGVALIRLREGRISHWREYQHVDPRSWEQFSAATAGLDAR